MEWYYANAGERSGPVEESELEALYKAGKLRSDTLVWTAGMADWQPLSLAKPSLMDDSRPDGRFCTECGREFDPADLVPFGAARVCAGCKDVFFQRVREQGVSVATQGTGRRYGGFWIRALARLVDGLILSAVLAPLGFVLALLLPRVVGSHPAPVDPRAFGPLLAGVGFVYLISFTIALLYEGWFLSNRGGTPGKLVCGLRVVRPNGQNLSFARGCGRYLAALLSGLMLYIGYIMAAFDEQKRALHDHICDTRVVTKSA